MATAINSSIKAAAVRKSRRLTDKYGFRIVSPLLAGDVGFVTMSELKMSTEVIKYRAGGSLIPSKSPGLSDFDPITATRGATTRNHELLNWKLLVVDGAAAGPASIGSPRGIGTCPETVYKAWISIVQTNRCHQAIKRWVAHGAFPTEFSAADGFDANASDHVFESMTWEYDYFELVNPDDGMKVSISVAGKGFSSKIDSFSGLNFASLDNTLRTG